jgi:ribosome-binding factor A
MARKVSKSTGQRPLRVGEEVRHALAQILERGDLRDPDLVDAVVTITEVRMSPDIRNATVFVAPLGGIDTDKIVKALERAAPYLRRRIADVVELRYVPNLRIEADTSFDYAERIGQKLSEVVDGDTAPDADPDDNRDRNSE